MAAIIVMLRDLKRFERDGEEFGENVRWCIELVKKSIQSRERETQSLVGILFPSDRRIVGA
jgi:hypothetical protein